MSETEGKPVLARGQGASPGIARGQIVFDAAEAVRLAAEGASIILVRIETSAEDVPGIRAAVGIVTTRGGLTSDAAIIARSLGKPCIAGCSTLGVSYTSQRVNVADGEPLERLRWITIDGSRGLVYDG
jgi:pyruvate, orthophosphate dikinase